MAPQNDIMQTSVCLETLTTDLRTHTSALLKDPKRSTSARDTLRALVAQSLVNLGRFCFHHEGCLVHVFRAKTVVLPWVTSNFPLYETNCWGCRVYRVWKPYIPKVFLR
jgi:hypothetical protein